MHEVGEDGIENIGGLRWQNVLCLLAIYIICYFSLWKGISTSGKVGSWLSAAVVLYKQTVHVYKQYTCIQTVYMYIKALVYAKVCGCLRLDQYIGLNTKRGQCIGLVFDHHSNLHVFFGNSGKSSFGVLKTNLSLF